MYHLLAFTVNSAGGVTNQDTPGVNDGFATLNAANHYILQDPWYLVWAYAAGVNLLNQRINSPPLRNPNIPSIGPIDAAATPTTLPPIAWLNPSPIQIPAIDELTLESTDAAVAGQLYGFLGLCNTPSPIRTVPPGKPTRLRLTAAITTGNKVWGNGAMTPDQTLAAGRYAVVGMDVVGANLLAARLVFPTAGPRPGVIARTSVSNKPDPSFLSGELGEFGQFESTALPSLDLFGNAAPTTQTIYLNCVKIR